METVLLHRIWRETINRLESLDRAVQESKRLDEALNFSRWVFWSGLCELCEQHSAPAPLKVDGAFLRWKCQDLQGKVQERFRLNDSAPHIEATELESINHKLDLIAGYISKLSPPVDGNATAGNPAEPALRVIPGGVDFTKEVA